ncbi:uncharacterized protein LOC133893156 [Phragmites australis]|uniref:uncharacterized protein LOC133893156 n=1 Tax=Phragmites australis TaxID=29695 RepID=UPI002D7A12B8|nr:uncharacterized protein LOC133893156 [Phragmites australis]
MATRASAPSTIRRDAVRAAEGVAREVLLRLHPTEEAERRRQGVIAYLKRVIGSSLGCEVFAFGSVPLKTYLPDGDVDITVLGNTWLNSTFMDGVRYVLEAEKHCDAEFELTGLNFINAEVKLIKCVIDNIVVDVSFNQIGGVSTFCFLELVDRQVGENHLFKRSIMLIKAWCYHESRILGAHHGLISTYALETLVLYIFNMFHNSLHGPLEVLYRFLEYFSKFDWDQYGISLNGPVDLSSLPNLSVEPTAVHDELLLGKEFLQGSLDRLVVIPDSSDGCDTNFRTKYLNIIDPLKGNNNLGRSVSKASFYRIRSAFSFGAQKLGQILMLPSELIPDEICGFFANTLKRHGKGERPDLGDYSSFESLLGPENALNGEGSSFNSCMNEGENRSPCHSSKLPDKESNVADMHKNSGRYLPGDVLDLPWNKIWFMEYASDFRANSSNLASFRSHSSFSRENGNGNSEQCFKNYATEEDLHLISRLHMPQQIYANHHILATSTRTNTLDFSNSCPVSESDWTAFRAEKKPLPSFSQPNMLDLSGDLDLHLGCLRKVQYHLECLFDELLQAVQEACLASVLDEDSFQIPTVSLMSNTDTRPPRLSLASSTDSERRKLSSVYCSYSTGDVSQQPHAEDQVDVVWWQNVPLPSNVLALSSSLATNSEYYPVYWFSDSPKTRGTGTYIPKISYNMYKERMTPGRGIMPERGRKLKQRLPDQKYSSLEQGCSGPGNEHTTVHRATNQMPMKQNSSQQDGYSSKSSVPKGGFVHFREQVATEGGTKPVATNLPKVQNNQGIAPSPAIGDSSRDFVEKGRQPKSSSSGIVLPQLCQGNPPVSNTCQPSSPPTAGYCQLKAQVEENLEFGSLGPFSLGLLSAQFEEEFPPLPATKRPAEVPLRTSKTSAEVPASTVLSPKPVDRESRPQDVYQLKDEADFPPLQAGYR